MVGEVDVFFLPSRNRDLDKLKSKLIMEKGMLDTCDVNISMVCNHCKSLLEEMYRSVILARVFSILLHC